MRILLITLMLLLSSNTNAQFFKDVYKDFLKYGTVYAAGNVGNSYITSRPTFFIRTDPDDLYAIPDVIDETVYHPFDYRYGIGIRKLARFDYEVKGSDFYNGIGEDENNIGLSAPTAAIKGLEYLIHYEKERRRGEEWINSRYFVRHTGKYHIAKVEQREQGNVDFKYFSAEARARLPIGKKFSVSAGVIYRTHEKAYGYNPVEIWLNEENEFGNAANPWYSLGYEYGYSDHYTEYTDVASGVTAWDWIWRDADGVIAAYGDRDFRDRVYGSLMNRFNNEAWEEIEPFGVVSPVVGFDFYHYKNNFWLHAYGNYLLP